MDEIRGHDKGQVHQPEKKKFRMNLLAGPEGRLLLAGVAMAFVFTSWLAFKLLFSPDEFQVLIGMTATEIMFGRAAAMAFGYSLGLEHTLVIPICMILETILVLLFYPLFVLSWRHLLVTNLLKKVFEQTHKVAEANKDKVQKYGVIGLFAFVWFPFWMTGPVVGCVIGFLLGMRVWQNMAVVLIGTYIAILGWAFFLRHFHERVASYSSYGAMILMGLLFLIIVLGHLLHKTLRENKK
jgi:uncharacterized membrane protein